MPSPIKLDGARLRGVSAERGPDAYTEDAELSAESAVRRFSTSSEPASSNPSHDRQAAHVKIYPTAEDPITSNEDQGSSVAAAKAPLEEKSADKPVAWRSLPRKDQLLILVLARLAEPIAQTSLSSYMFFMLKSFDQTLSDSEISSQAGFLAAGFTAAQCITAVIWGRLADKESFGRKNVLIIGLAGTLVSIVGFGFSTSFATAVFFRIVGGALNGNIGVMRTMISEIIKEKKYQPKAFLCMPITFNIGVLIGPLLGGWLQDPVHTFPKLFGPGSHLGGQDGVQWMLQFPYALPNLVMGVFLFSATLLVILGLEETHIDRQHLPDYGLNFGRAIWRLVCCKPAHKYTQLSTEDTNALEMAMTPTTPTPGEPKSPLVRRPKLPYRRMFTRNVMLTFLVHGLMAMSVGAFNNMWFLFLSTPRYDPSHPQPSGFSPHMPFAFTGGLGLPPPTIGLAVGILGALGLCLQFGVYSNIIHRLGIVRVYRYALLLFPTAYLIIPYLAVTPTSSEPPSAADGPWVWLGITFLLLIVVTGRTFALPATQILINNCSPHPSVLSSIHGLGQSVSSGTRTIGPVVFSTLYGVGLNKGVVGLAWWCLAIEAITAFAASWLIYEGSGHEIRLDGDPE